MESSVIPGGLHFSYNTCGQLDRYSVFSAFATGRTLRISTGISPPYVTAATTATDSDSAVPGWPYDGSLVAFADALCKNFDAPPAINVTGDFATAESMAALGPFSTPWSACTATSTSFLTRVSLVSSLPPCARRTVLYLVIMGVGCGLLDTVP